MAIYCLDYFIFRKDIIAQAKRFGIEVEIVLRDWVVAGVAFLPGNVEVGLHWLAGLLWALIVVCRDIRPYATTCRLYRVAMIARLAVPGQI